MNSDLKDRYADSYKNCVDKEVLQGGSSSSSSGGVSPSWSQMDNMDVAGKDIASGGKSFTEVRQPALLAQCQTKRNLQALLVQQLQ